MKKILIAVLLAIFGYTGTAQKRPNLFIYNKPLSFLANNFEVGFDKLIGENVTFGTMLGYGSREQTDFQYTEKEEIKFEVNLKYFLKDYNAKRTFYASPFLMYKSIKLTDYDYYYGPTNSMDREFNASALFVGFQFAKRYNWNRVYLDLQVGGGILQPMNGEKEDRYYISNPATPYSKGVHPRLGANFGISF